MIISSRILAAVIVFFGCVRAEAAIEFFDDFNDGNADGWVFPYRPGWNNSPGEWSVQNETLAQDGRGDHHVGLVEGLILSDQIVETDVLTRGYAGITVWHYDVRNFTTVFAYPLSAGIGVLQMSEGVSTRTDYGYRTWHNQSYDLLIDADSATGELGIYLDGVHVATHQTDSLYRSGSSGVTSGNGWGQFDNFHLRGGAIPEPTALIVWSALAIFGLLRRRRF